MNIARMLHSGSEAQYKGDSRNHGLDPNVFAGCWGPSISYRHMLGSIPASANWTAGLEENTLRSCPKSSQRSLQ